MNYFTGIMVKGVRGRSRHGDICDVEGGMLLSRLIGRRFGKWAEIAGGMALPASARRS